MLFRHNVERLPATAASDVRRHAAQGRVDVIVVDSAICGASGLVAALRQDPLTRPTAIVALGRSEFGLGQLDILQAGANAILPLPPGADWDDRLMRLLNVPMRKVTRLPVEPGDRGRAARRAARARPLAEPQRPRHSCSSAATRSRSATTSGSRSSWRAATGGCPVRAPSCARPSRSTSAWS